MGDGNRDSKTQVIGTLDKETQKSRNRNIWRNIGSMSHKI